MLCKYVPSYAMLCEPQHWSGCAAVLSCTSILSAIPPRCCLPHRDVYRKMLQLLSERWGRQRGRNSVQVVRNQHDGLRTLCCAGGTSKNKKTGRKSWSCIEGKLTHVTLFGKREKHPFSGFGIELGCPKYCRARDVPVPQSTCGKGRTEGFPSQPHLHVAHSTSSVLLRTVTIPNSWTETGPHSHWTEHSSAPQRDRASNTAQLQRRQIPPHQWQQLWRLPVHTGCPSDWCGCRRPAAALVPGTASAFLSVPANIFSTQLILLMWAAQGHPPLTSKSCLLNKWFLILDVATPGLHLPQKARLKCCFSPLTS